MTIQSPPLVSAVTLGSLAGVGLAMITAFSTRGPLIYWPYVLLVIALVGLVWWYRPLSRADRFRLVLTGFMTASLILYLYIVLVDSPSALSLSVLDHSWRLGFLVSVGALVSATSMLLTE